MAELNNTPLKNVTKKTRARKQAPKVDLTAMVDLAFLLITFFMLTTSLNKPYELEVAVPDKSANSTHNMDERRIVNLIINENSVDIYHGNMEVPIESIKNIRSTENDLTNTLNDINHRINSFTGGKPAIVLIKPTKEATTKDIIHSFNEIRKASIKHYMLSKLSNEEEKVLQ